PTTMMPPRITGTSPAVPTANRHGAARQNPMPGMSARARWVRADHQSESVLPRSMPPNAAAANVDAPYSPDHFRLTPSSVLKNDGSQPRTGQYAAPLSAFMASRSTNPRVESRARKGFDGEPGASATGWASSNSPRR